MSVQSPEYTVDCSMCEGTFSATADSIDELLGLVRFHIDAMEFDKHHQQYKPYPHTDAEILRSDHFTWEIKRLRPFTKLEAAVEKFESIERRSQSEDPRKVIPATH